MLHRDEFVLHVLGGLFRFGKHHVHGGGNVDFACLPAGAGDLGQAAQHPAGAGGNILRGQLHFQQQLGNQALILFQKGDQQMNLLHLHVLVLYREILRRLDGFQGFLGEFLGIHKTALLIQIHRIQQATGHLPKPYYIR